jgi:DNA polymerase-1
MLDEPLENVITALAGADAPAAKRETRAKRAAVAKIAETTAQAFDRIRLLKLDDEERVIVTDVERLVAAGKVVLPITKLSKKAVFVIYDGWRLEQRESLKQRIVDTKPDNYWIVTDIIMLNRLSALMDAEPLIAFDTETTGLDIYEDRIVGWSISLPIADIHAYVPFGHTTGQSQLPEAAVMGVAKRYLENATNKTVWWHTKYDQHLLANHGVYVANVWWDGMAAAKILNENELSYSLKKIHAKYILGNVDDAVSFGDLFDDKTIYDKDIVLSGVYACGDTHKTLQMYEFQKPFIDERDNLKTIWYDVEQPLLTVDFAMERTGFRLDIDHLAGLADKFEPLIVQAEQSLLASFNIDAEFMVTMSTVLGRVETQFNVNSPQHLAYLIYDVVGVDPDFPKRFRKAVRSTAAEVVDALCDDTPELAPLLRYRKLGKMLQTYIRKLPLAVERSGLLHVAFNNLSNESGSTSGAATGRYSSSEHTSSKHSRLGDVARGCNIQNIPAKGEGVEIRKAFIPDDGWVFIGSDLSKIEPVIIAHILSTRYNDHTMRDIFLDGRDIYTESAMQIFAFPRELCVDGAYDPTGRFKPRALAKQGVLAYLYGSSAKSFARNMGIDAEIGETFFESMLAAYPGIETFRADVLRQLLSAGNVAHVETLWGRKRRFPDYRKNHAELSAMERGKNRWKMSAEDKERRSKLWGLCARVERQALNSIVQGSGADILKMNLAALYRWCVEHGYKLHASIHDEIWISLPITGLTPDVVADVNRIMATTVHLCVPILSDTVIQPRWSDEYKPSQWDFVNGRPLPAA